MSRFYSADIGTSASRVALSPARGDQRREALAVKIAACAIAPLVLALAALGGLGSFATVRDMARPWFGELAWIVPVGMDVGILILLSWDLLMEYVALPWPVLRWVAWSFIGGTVAVNVMAADGDPAGMLMHAAMPVLFITVVEGIRHLIRQWVGLATGTRIERIPTARWMLAPVSTALLWRRTVLWHVPTYRQALDLELRHLTAVSQLQQRYGRWAWRWKAPLSERLELRRLPGLAVGYADSSLNSTRLSVGNEALRLPVVADRGHERAVADDGEDEQGGPRDGATEPTEADAELLEAAASVVADMRRRGRHPSRTELGRQLREMGFTVSNGRLGELRAAAAEQLHSELPAYNEADDLPEDRTT